MTCNFTVPYAIGSFTIILESCDLPKSGVSCWKAWEHLGSVIPSWKILDFRIPVYLMFLIFLFQETKDEDLEKLVQAHCRLDLTAPMPGCTGNHQRNLLFEGDLKLKEGTSSKVSFSQSQGWLASLVYHSYFCCFFRVIVRYLQLVRLNKTLPRNC